MSDALDRRDRLAPYSGERGSLVLVTERRQAIGPLTCETCNQRHSGGIARGVVLDEPGVRILRGYYGCSAMAGRNRITAGWLRVRNTNQTRCSR